MQITLVPTAGLCNRMNAILSAIALNQHYHYPINIYWEKTSDCCAEYTDFISTYRNRRHYNFFITQILFEAWWEK